MDVFTDNEIEVILPTVKERISKEELIEYIDGVHGVISGHDQFTERVLKRVKNLSDFLSINCDLNSTSYHIMGVNK
jgi:hypothetical protein